MISIPNICYNPTSKLNKKLYIVSFTALLVIIIVSGSVYYFKNKKQKPGTGFFDPHHQRKHQKFISKLPEDLTFAGERVHFKHVKAYKIFYKELKINTTSNSSTRLLLRNVRLWMPQIEQILKKYQIPEDFKYVAVAESNLSNVVSHKGAAGFWQLKEETAQGLGLEVNDEVDERYHPIKSTVAACKYFQQAYKRFGNWTSAAASYNRGMNGLERAFQKQSVNSYYDLDLNQETARYIFRILAIKDLLITPEKYKLKVKKSQQIRLEYFKVDTTVNNLEKFASQINVDYSVLKDYNSWLLKNSLTIKDPKKVYYISVPTTAITKKEKRVKIDSLQVGVPAKPIFTGKKSS